MTEIILGMFVGAIISAVFLLFGLVLGIKLQLDKYDK